MPTDSFWDGVGKSIEHASGDIVVAAVFAVAIVFLVVKYYIPERKERKKFQAEMQQKRLELEIKQQQDNADIQRENIEQKARELQILSGVQTTQETLVTMVGDVNVNLKVLLERIDDSKSHSQNLVSTQQNLVSTQGKIQDDVSIIKEQVNDIHHTMYHPTVVD